MKTKIYFQKLATFLLAFVAIQTSANNLKITGTSVNTGAGTVTFNVQWDNSWKTNLAPANFDAVWVFIKYQDCADKLWKHATLSTVSGDHSTSSPLIVDAVTDGKGVFVHRSANGGGNIPATEVTLKLNISGANYANFNYKVVGIEMVNVPQGAFWVGDGNTSQTYNKYKITSNASISSSSTNLGAGESAPTSFPKGFNEFYSMKYEISQEQYKDFLNSLTYHQQANRTVENPDSPKGTNAFSAADARNGIEILVPGHNSAIPAVYACNLTDNEDYDDANDGQNIAMNTLSWNDFTAYLDWAALRPMTELEFEKICRGPLDPVKNEYAWGTTDLNYIVPTGVINQGEPNEGYNTVINGRANYHVLSGYTTISFYGSVKVGFTATGSSGRVSASAGYYGGMELSGNASELTVNTKSNGNTYTGILGDGELSDLATTNGNANQSLWPDFQGVIVRGGGFRGAPSYGATNSYMLRTSDRTQGSPSSDSHRAVEFGGRGVR